MTVGEDVEKPESSYATGNGKAPSPFGKVWPFLKWLKRVYYMIQQCTPRYIPKSTEDFSISTQKLIHACS